MDGAKFNPIERLPVIPEGEAMDTKLKIQPKICEKCGGKYIPTNNRQKQCPQCRALERKEHDRIDRHKRLAKARQPGEVVTYKIEPPKKETPERILKQQIEAPERKKGDLPDQLYSVEQIIDVIRKYYAGELVEKPEPVKPATVTERLQRVAERVCDEICRHREAFDAEGAGDSLYDELLDEHCAKCPLNELGGVDDV